MLTWDVCSLHSIHGHVGIAEEGRGQGGLLLNYNRGVKQQILIMSKFEVKKNIVCFTLM